jgi:quinolinate synthase
MADTAPIKRRIRELASEKDAIILAHNYQAPDVQDVADVIGDSLALSIEAIKADRGVIVFCGVDFMAQSAKALNPGKKVVHPVQGAMCPMAHMVDVEGLRKFRERFPGAPVVAYINTTAEVKAEADICCTSGNAVKVVRSLSEDRVIFIPDSNLALYVQSQVPEKEVIPWAGYCHVHQGIRPEQVRALKASHPGARFIAHPECSPDVIALADKVASTEGMLKYAREDPATEFILGTEEGLAYRLTKEVKGKTFHRIPEAVCPNMKKIGLADVERALTTLSPEVTLSENIIERNRAPLQRMLALK